MEGLLEPRGVERVAGPDRGEPAQIHHLDQGGEVHGVPGHREASKRQRRHCPPGPRRRGFHEAVCALPEHPGQGLEVGCWAVRELGGRAGRDGRPERPQVSDIHHQPHHRLPPPRQHHPAELSCIIPGTLPKQLTPLGEDSPMLSMYRGLLAGLLVAGLAALGDAPAGAQVKKDEKKDPKKDAAVVVPKKEPKKDDARERSVSFATSDGLALNGYWFQGSAIEKQRPDAVLMFPAPGNKISDAWIDLARDLSTKNFSVLLFDWRGCGLNGPEAGSRIFESTERFWAESYNNRMLKSRRQYIEDKGLDYKDLVGRVDGNMRYRDWFFNDLTGARFFLDKQNDNGKCNTNRVWVISEKEGAHLGLAFIATEFWRNTIYQSAKTVFDIERQVRSAGKDYAGMMALSYSPSNGTASKVIRNALSEGNRTAQVNEFR